MNRTEALRLWRWIAEGGLESDDPHDFEEIQRKIFQHEDLRAWIRQVAQQVVDADAVPDGVRAGTLVDAIGLSGRLDPYSGLRRTLEILSEFGFIGDDGKEREAKRGEVMKVSIVHARASGLFDDQMTDDEIRKRIDRLLLSKRADTAKRKK